MKELVTIKTATKVNEPSSHGNIYSELLIRLY